MSTKDYAAQARSYRSTAAAFTVRATRDARFAEQEYARADWARRHALWLTQRLHLNRPEEKYLSPAWYEQMAATSTRLADSMLQGSWKDDENAAFYRQLAATYRQMAVDQANPHTGGTR